MLQFDPSKVPPPAGLGERLARHAPSMLSCLRIVVGLLFFEHGSARMIDFPHNGPMPPVFDLRWIAGLIEFVAGALIAAGLFTRTAAFIASGEMAFAYFISHAPRGFFPLLNHGDGAVLYCFVFLYFAFAGAGPWSLDALWRKGRA